MNSKRSRLNGLITADRNRLRYRAALFFSAFIIVLTAFAPAIAARAEAPARIRRNILRTSWDPESYAVFEASGDRIEARGKYSRDRLFSLYIDSKDVTGFYSVDVDTGGSFTGEVACSVGDPDVDHALCVELRSGVVMKYRIYRDEKGWYFPDNGLGEKSRAVFEHIYEAPAQAAGLYLSSSASGDEIASALEQIKLYTEGVTFGIEDDYEKALAISRFISDSIYYDHDAKETNADLETIALNNVLKSCRTVCGGFANLFCAMAEAAGLDAVNIKGGVTSDSISYDRLGEGVQNHEWAAFRYEKESRWVWVDPCWDGAGDYVKGKYTEKKTKEMYFDMTDEAFSLNHRADKAERRRYFSALAETAPLYTAEPDAAAPSTQAPAVTQAPIRGENTPYTLPRPADSVPDSGSELPEWVYITAIVVLSVLTAGAAVFLAVVRKKGKNEKEK